MKQTEKIREDYFNQARSLLLNHPNALPTFDQLWQVGKFREAYLYIDEMVLKLNIVVSSDKRDIDEAFFWTVLN
jgi:hypothetical protein